MGADVAGLATLTLGNGFRLTEKVNNNGATFAARVRNNPFEAVHLPNVPRDNVSDILQRFQLRFFAELARK